VNVNDVLIVTDQLFYVTYFHRCVRLLWMCINSELSACHCCLRCWVCLCDTMIHGHNLCNAVTNVNTRDGMTGTHNTYTGTHWHRCTHWHPAASIKQWRLDAVV